MFVNNYPANTILETNTDNCMLITEFMMQYWINNINHYIKTMFYKSITVWKLKMLIISLNKWSNLSFTSSFLKSKFLVCFRTCIKNSKAHEEYNVYGLSDFYSKNLIYKFLPGEQLHQLLVKHASSGDSVLRSNPEIIEINGTC